MSRVLGPTVSAGWVLLVLLFIYAPIIVVVGASLDPGRYVQSRAFLQFPPTGLTLYWYSRIEPSLWQSLRLSAVLASAVAIAATLVGVPAALGIVRGSFPGRNLVAALLRAPLQIPFIVTGVAFLQAYFAISAALGLTIQGSFLGLFLPHLFVAMPYVIGAAGASLQQVPPNLDAAARSLGAPPLRSFLRVTLPLIMPGIFGGTLYAFLVSFTDTTIALFLSPNGQETFPVWVFSSVQNDLEPSVPAISSLVFFASVAILFLVQKLIGMDAVLKSGGAKS